MPLRVAMKTNEVYVICAPDGTYLDVDGHTTTGIRDNTRIFTNLLDAKQLIHHFYQTRRRGYRYQRLIYDYEQRRWILT